MRLLGFIIMFALLMLVAGYLGWIAVESTTAGESDQEKFEVTMDKGKIKEDTGKVADEVKELSHDTGEGIRKIAQDIGDKFSANDSKTLTAHPKSVELEPGASARITVTRSGNTTKALQLTFVPSNASRLLVSGGEFGAGESEAVVTIEAPAEARDGSVQLEGQGDSERVDVLVIGKI